MSLISAAFRAVLRTDFYAFVYKVFLTLHEGEEEAFQPNWHIQAICYHLERVTRGETLRLLISVPPRHLKSICAAVAWPAWMLGNDPASKIMVASYGAELASKHASDFRKVLE